MQTESAKWTDEAKAMVEMCLQSFLDTFNTECRKRKRNYVVKEIHRQGEAPRKKRYRVRYDCSFTQEASQVADSDGWNVFGKSGIFFVKKFPLFAIRLKSDPESGLRFVFEGLHTQDLAPVEVDREAFKQALSDYAKKCHELPLSSFTSA